MQINNVIIAPVLTEKSTRLVNSKTYTFMVNPDASKTQIKAALEELFKVKVAAVNVVTKKGKIRRVGRRMTPKAATDRKLAYVKLKEGKIALFPES